MPTAFPTALDNFTNPGSGHYLDSPGFLHDEVHANVFDAIEALESVVGISGSPTPATIDYRLSKANTLSSPGAATIPFVVKGAAAQSANLTDWRTSLDAVLLAVTSSGQINSVVPGVGLKLGSATSLEVDSSGASGGRLNVGALNTQFGTAAEPYTVNHFGQHIATQGGEAAVWQTPNFSSQIWTDLRRFTNAGNTEYKFLRSYVTSAVATISGRASTDAGISNDFTMMSGRFGINWNSDTIPDQTLVIKSRNALQLARFRESVANFSLGDVGFIRTATIRDAEPRVHLVGDDTALLPGFDAAFDQTQTRRAGMYFAANGALGASAGIYTKPDSTAVTRRVALFDAGGITYFEQGGISVDKSVSGHTGGEVRLGTATASQESVISTYSVSSPKMLFDHKGTNNSGSWVWRNASSGVNERMLLTGEGALRLKKGLGINLNTTPALSTEPTYGVHLGTAIPGAYSHALFENDVYLGADGGGNTGARKASGAMELFAAGASNPNPYIQMRRSDATTEIGFRFDLFSKFMHLNPERTNRNTGMYLDTKNNLDSSGARWTWYADADNSVVGTNALSLYGYPRDSAGTTLGSEQFLTFDFNGAGNVAGYTKRTRFHTQLTAMEGQVTASAIAASNNAVYSDNDGHSWETDGLGGLRMAARGNTTNAIFRWIGGIGTYEMARLDNAGSIGTTDTALMVYHGGSLKRVLAGAQGSGPGGGTTRQLYLAS